MVLQPGMFNGEGGKFLGFGVVSHQRMNLYNNISPGDEFPNRVGLFIQDDSVLDFCNVIPQPLLLYPLIPTTYHPAAVDHR
jgi:hypothetical protein